MTSRYDRLRGKARDFLAEAFDALAIAHVLPRSRHEPWIHVGQHFGGYLLDSLDSYHALVQELEGAFPQTFAGKERERDFAGLYPFPLVTAAVYKITRGGSPYLATSQEAAEAVEELIRLLRADADTVTSIRVVSDIVVANELLVGDVRIRPLADGVQVKPIPIMIEELVPEAGYGADEARGAMFAHDRAMLIATSSERRPRHHRLPDSFTVAGDRNDRAIDQTLIAVRLITNATSAILLSVRGSSGQLHRYPPTVYPEGVPPWRFVRRPARIDAGTTKAIKRLGPLVSQAPGAIGLAISRFNRSYFNTSWWERLVDLSIALEAAIGEPDARDDVTFRLRTRSAILLATAGDPAAAIYDDVGHLYSIRSKVLHGVPTKPRDIERILGKVVATAPGPMPGDKTELLVDRLRDLVRRAILLRLVLLQGPEPLWPVDAKNIMDRLLTGEADRRHVRATWLSGLRALGIPGAIEAAPPALLN